MGFPDFVYCFLTSLRCILPVLTDDMFVSSVWTCRSKGLEESLSVLTGGKLFSPVWRCELQAYLEALLDFK